MSLPDVTLLTPTGGRPKAFMLCEKYMARQTYKGNIHWVVVDDCEPRTKCTMGQQYLRGPVSWMPGMNTQHGNMLTALKGVKGDLVFFIEDDDWYSPEYIETMVDLHEALKVPIWGEGDARYYNVATRSWKRMENMHHCSLCQTAIETSMVHVLKKAIETNDKYFDITLWAMSRQGNAAGKVVLDLNLSMGIKGMPGRHGIGVGHEPDDKWKNDPFLTQLKRWIGEDWRNYRYFSEL
jgi:hypothetical protein